MQELPSRGIEDAEVALIRRCIPDVAARHGDDTAAGVGERRRDLLALRQGGDGGGPEDVSVGYAELLDVAIGRCRVDGRSVWIGDWRHVRYPGRAGQLAEVRRREAPEDAAVVRIDRERFAVRRGNKEDVVPSPVHLNVVEIDGRRVDGAVDRDLLPLHRRDVCLGNARRRVECAATGHVEVERRPIVAIRRNRWRVVIRAAGVGLVGMRGGAREEDETEQSSEARHGGISARAGA